VTVVVVILHPMNGYLIYAVSMWISR